MTLAEIYKTVDDTPIEIINDGCWIGIFNPEYLPSVYKDFPVVQIQAVPLPGAYRGYDAVLRVFV